MGNIVLIVILATVVFVAVAWLTREREGKQSQNETSTGGIPIDYVAEGWRMKVIGSGQIVTINNQRAEICNICLVCDSVPKFKYRYKVSFSFEYIGGESTLEDSGIVSENSTFSLNGKEYYGVILAGGPNARLKDIQEYSVK